MKTKNYILYSLLLLSTSGLYHGCANRAQGPTGGPKDTIPPVVVKSFPENGSTNFHKSQIEIDFDENVSVQKISENVIISPPQLHPPDVKASGKKVTVNFNENLIDSTTYTIGFGNSIVDLDEGNPLKNYTFSFATGSQIDTLQISGTVINAEDLNPLSGIIVGIYQAGADSLFTRKPFLRIARTDDKGQFTIENIHAGSYKIYALDDSNHDYFFEPGEGLAFDTSIIKPTVMTVQKTDTIAKNVMKPDSLKTRLVNRFMPDNVTLRFFRENKKRQYLVKYERKEPFSFSLFFNDAATRLPEVKPMNFQLEGKSFLQHNANNDSLTYWLTDSLAWKTDTLKMAVSYLKTDSLYHLVPTTDTISLWLRQARQKPVRRTGAHSQRQQAYRFDPDLAQDFDVYRPIVFHFESPLDSADLKKIHLLQKVDTTYKIIRYLWQPVDSGRMTYALQNQWKPESEYELRIDSAAFRSIYHLSSNKYSYKFKIKSLDDYSKVKIMLKQFNPKAVFQILDSKDVVLATKKAEEKGTVFEYLKPGDYYVRMFIDENGNGKWDTGDLSSLRQPEEVYYYPKKLTLMANWEFEETWNPDDTPLLQQKPDDIKKDGNKKKDGN